MLYFNQMSLIGQLRCEMVNLAEYEPHHEA